MLNVEDSTDRRAVARRPCYESSCRLLHESEEGPCLADVVDISTEGVSLLCWPAPQIGDLLTLELTGPDKGLSLSQCARVVHVTQSRDGFYLVGCAFTHDIPETLSSLLR